MENWGLLLLGCKIEKIGLEKPENKGLLIFNHKDQKTFFSSIVDVVRNTQKSIASISVYSCWVRARHSTVSKY